MKNKSDRNDLTASTTRAREKAAWNDALLTMLAPGLQKLFCPQPSEQEQPHPRDTGMGQSNGHASEDSEPEEPPETMIRLGKANDNNDGEFSESVLDAQDYVAARQARKQLKG